MNMQTAEANHARDVVVAARKARGLRSYRAGHAAEMQVARHYLARGAELLHSCWRGQAGEIDLILRLDGEYVFVEVKKSRSFASAAECLRNAQMDRICLAAQEFIGTLPTGMLTPMRIDVALVDAVGRIEILENAIGH